jgi:hypothetical protein
MAHIDVTYSRARAVHIAPQGGIRIKARLLAVGFVWMLASSATAATSQNSTSPLGMNLAGINYYSPEMPFIDNFKSSGSWITQSSSTWDTDEEAYLNLDSNGWPITLTANSESKSQRFNSVAVLLMRNLPSTPNGYYPAGQYYVIYQGQGNITYSFDATLVSHSNGQDVINVTKPTSAGILLSITATDPKHTGNYIRNIQVIKAENLAALNAGQIFNPAFLALVQKFRALRFMDWLNTNNNTLSSWSARPLKTNAFWGGKNGAPLEVAVALSNAVGSDAWLNIPVMADDNYITQMATLVHDSLGSSQKVYVELSNEVWNSEFTQSAYATAQGHATFASGLGTSFDYNRNWYGMRVAQSCDIWKSVWGSESGRVVCVMGAQAANPYTATESLNCPFWTSGTPCAGHGIGAVAIAPYFGGSVPPAWTSQSDGGLSSLFASLRTQNDPAIPNGGWLSQASGWEAAYAAALASYKLPLVAYEAGQTFEGFPNGVTATGAISPLTKLYIAANRDSRMANAYTSYLQQWKSNGGTLLMHFDDILAYSQYGEWGALESIMQTTTPLSSSPPKWQAIMGFISSNSCWWANCTGTVASSAVPMAPTNLTVH